MGYIKYQEFVEYVEWSERAHWIYKVIAIGCIRIGRYQSRPRTLKVWLVR